MLESYLREKRSQKEILLMTHIVLGYPSFSQAYRIVEAMVEAGVDLIELQIPFSEPMADGPVILNANQSALAAGSSVEQCLAFAGEVCARFEIPFLFMSYYNILYKYGVDRFAAAMAKAGIRGAIVPDLPPEEAEDYLKAMVINQLAPVFIFSPNTPDQRLQFIADHAKGFIYCVARTGVTGSRTEFSQQLDAYLNRCRRATKLPLALGFGVKDKADIDFLRGKVDIAVIGSQTIRTVDKKGVEAVEGFIRGLTL
ncbi:MAG: tryptophan synthase subunit alpha [Deltaproteobacteria bacterium]|nr:tryptophan synthase subunit alpha [Deltaproteobacteria bacterium]